MIEGSAKRAMITKILFGSPPSETSSSPPPCVSDKDTDVQPAQPASFAVNVPRSSWVFHTPPTRSRKRSWPPSPVPASSSSSTSPLSHLSLHFSDPGSTTKEKDPQKVRGQAVLQMTQKLSCQGKSHLNDLKAHGVRPDGQKKEGKTRMFQRQPITVPHGGKVVTFKMSKLACSLSSGRRMKCRT